MSSKLRPGTRCVRFPEGEALIDVLRHPVDGRLYVASWNESLFSRPPILHTVDPETLELVRSVPAPGGFSCASIVFGGVLAAGGSDGRIHVLGRAGVDGGWWVWSFDRM